MRDDMNPDKVDVNGEAITLGPDKTAVLTNGAGGIIRAVVRSDSSEPITYLPGTDYTLDPATGKITGLTFGDSTITEKSLSAAETSGLKVTAGDGIKYGRINLKSKTSGAVIVGVDIDLTIDTIGPTLTFLLNGR